MKIKPLIKKATKAISSFVKKLGLGPVTTALILFGIALGAGFLTGRPKFLPQLAKSQGIESTTAAIASFAFSLVVLLGAMLVRWLKSDGEKQVDAGAPPPRATVPGNRYIKVWDRFLSSLETDTRRSIDSFQPFIVLGATRAKKTELISKYVDWQRQRDLMHGGGVQDPHLEIYLGGRELAIDLPEKTLNDTSEESRDALERLWSKVLKRRDPIIIVAAPPPAWVEENPDKVRNLADRIRGKINQIAQVRKKAIEVRVILTTMESLEGFDELADLTSSEAISTRFLVDPSQQDYDIEGALGEELGKLDRHLSLALRKSEPDDFRKMVSYLRQMPRYLPRVATFLSALFGYDPLSQTPNLDGVYLPTTIVEGRVSNPFRTPRVPTDIEMLPLRRHKWSAALVATFLVLFMVGGSYREWTLWGAAQKSLSEYAELKPRREFGKRASRERSLRQPVMVFHRRWAFPKFFRSQDEFVAENLSSLMRKGIFTPTLRDLARPKEDLRRSLYSIAILLAGDGDDLAIEIGDNIQRYSDSTRLADLTQVPADVIRDYIEVTQVPLQPHEIDHELEDLRKGWRNPEQAGLTAYLRRVRGALSLRGTREGVRSDVLEEIQDGAQYWENELLSIQEYPDARLILDQVRKIDTESRLARRFERRLLETRHPELFGTASGSEAAVNERREAMIAFLLTIQDSSIRVGRQWQSLGELVAWLRKYVGGGELTTTTTSTLVPNGPIETPKEGTARLAQFDFEGYTYRESDWIVLTRENVVREGMKQFADHPPDDLFFTSKDYYPSLSMDLDTDDRVLFFGRAELDGRHTKVAFQEKVLPALTGYQEVLEKLEEALELDGRVVERIEKVIISHVRTYAEGYARGLYKFYDSLSLQTDGSRRSLILAFEQMVKSDSPLKLHLLTLARQADLPIRNESVGRLVEPLKDELREFRVLVKVMGEEDPKDQAYEEMYEGYLTRVLEKIGAPQEGDEAAAAEPAADGAVTLGPALVDRLSPIGLSAIDILTCTENSFREEIKSFLVDVQMPIRLRELFLVPVKELYKVGRTEIDAEIHAAWNGEVVDALRPIHKRFPFQMDSGDDVTPSEIEGIFHPINGKAAMFKGRFLDPLQVPAGCQTYVPPGLNPHARRLWGKVDRITQLLWNPENEPCRYQKSEDGVTPPPPCPGQPSAIPFEVRPVIGQHLTESTDGLKNIHQVALTYLRAEESTVFNFNQQPLSEVVPDPWWTDHVGQIGAQLVEPETRKRVFLDPLAVSSNWTVLRLLASAGSRTGDEWTWGLWFTDRTRADRPQRILVEITFEVRGPAIWRLTDGSGEGLFDLGTLDGPQKTAELSFGGGQP